MAIFFVLQLFSNDLELNYTVMSVEPNGYLTVNEGVPRYEQEGNINIFLK